MYFIYLKNAVNTEIRDLAHQHNHYLHGTPKREDEEAFHWVGG
jgi:hypothetical protein